ncbi:N-acyl homoserine lactonase family protein [Altererythrobacter rubellus]|uniref:N-acyl homoserine lactonase family protein n=1 Tax=Altererythrobacter rubellus TaxID=2173831 RepID=A0A9Y2BAH3_9SPHN|nr:N-acyl homoserine lactonase family protein [Altererythrobacter rubellus]WIW96268.1 N-acyl homoserine lactonase family protein [Altererythrobacter rubellus]
MKPIIFSLAMATSLAAPVSAQEAPDLEMWQLDCGTIELSDAGDFSDAHLYDGEERTLVVNCYLIRNADQYMLWDAGLSKDLIGISYTEGAFTVSMKRSLVDQLAELTLSPEDINLAAVSHYHFDHTSQLADFPDATLLIGAADWDVVKAAQEPNQLVDPRPFTPWLGEDTAPVTAIAQDHDVFGDGSVLIKATPGHTPGHASLLVRLPEKGDVLLTGDLYHFEEQVTNRGVPQFNTNRADTLASMARFDAIAKSLDATVIIQHDSRHLDRLPTFPESAK